MFKGQRFKIKNMKGFKIFLSLIVIAFTFSIVPAFAESQVNPTSGNSVDVKIIVDDDYVPGEETRMGIDFLTTGTDKIQVHIDYTVEITNDGKNVFGPIPLTHTSTGSVSIPVTLQDGTNEIMISVEGILFVPMPKETVSFDVTFGDDMSSDTGSSSAEPSEIPAWVKGNAGWWANDQIDDATFVSGIQYLISEGIISVSSTTAGSDSKSEGIPKWIKNNAHWWSQGAISDNDFLTGIEYLVENGVISVSSSSSSSTEKLEIGGVNLSFASPVFGEDDAPVTIIEFGDYQCPNCQKWFLNTKPDIVTNFIDTGKANLYFVDLAFLGDDSLTASAASYCAEEQGLYWEYHSSLYSNQRGIDGGWADIPSLIDYAEIIGMDVDEFSSCVDSGKYDESIVFNLEESINNGVQGTPSFIIVSADGETEMISGPQPYPVFKETIESFLS